MVGISIPATHYPFLPDLLLYLVNIYSFLWFCPLSSESEHVLATSEWVHVSNKGLPADMGEWHYVLNVGVSNFNGFTIVTFQEVFCSSVAFTSKGQPKPYDNCLDISPNELFLAKFILYMSL